MGLEQVGHCLQVFAQNSWENNDIKLNTEPNKTLIRDIGDIKFKSI